MNEPIISPWLIYLAETSWGVKIISMSFSICCAILWCVAYCGTRDNHNRDYYPQKVEEYEKDAKEFRNAAVIAVLIAALFPSGSTIYKMIAASYITPANIQATGELADKAVDKVIDKIADAIQKFERSEKK